MTSERAPSRLRVQEVLSSAAFDAVVPVLVALAVVLVVIGPWVSRRVAMRRPSAEPRRPVVGLVAFVQLLLR